MVVSGAQVQLLCNPGPPYFDHILYKPMHNMQALRFVCAIWRFWLVLRQYLLPYWSLKGVEEVKGVLELDLQCI